MANPHPNTANLRPPFTPEEASRISRQYHADRRARLDAEKRQAKLNPPLPIPDDDESRKRRVQKQIDSLLDELFRCDPRKKEGYERRIERLWKLVQPTCAPTKSRPNSGRSTPTGEPTPV